MKRSYRELGFTILELLVAISIALILAAILTTSIRSSITAAHRDASISNMKQMVAALLLYEADAQMLPPYSAAKSLITTQVTCDPQDYWTTCSGQFEDPLIGSYAYARGIKQLTSDEDWNRWVERYPNPTLLASVYYGSYRTRFINGSDIILNQPDMANCMKTRECLLPDIIIRARYDGSAKLEKSVIPKNATFAGNILPLMMWEEVFENHGAL